MKLKLDFIYLGGLISSLTVSAVDVEPSLLRGSYGAVLLSNGALYSLPLPQAILAQYPEVVLNRLSCKEKFMLKTAALMPTLLFLKMLTTFPDLFSCYYLDAFPIFYNYPQKMKILSDYLSEITFWPMLGIQHILKLLKLYLS